MRSFLVLEKSFFGTEMYEMVLMILPSFSCHWKITGRNRYKNLIVNCFVKCLSYVKFEVPARRDVGALK